VDATGLPVRFIITKGSVADCTQAEKLIKKYQQKPYWLIAVMTRIQLLSKPKTVTWR